MDNHEEKVSQLEATLTDHKKGPVPNKGLPLQNYKEKETYLQYEVSLFLYNIQIKMSIKLCTYCLLINIILINYIILGLQKSGTQVSVIQYRDK